MQVIGYSLDKRRQSLGYEQQKKRFWRLQLFRSIFINTFFTLLSFVNTSLAYSWRATCCMKHGSKACARWMHVTLCRVPTLSCLGKIC